MAEIDFVILADYVRNDVGVLSIVGGGFDRLTAATLPSGQNVGLGLRFLFTRTECPGPHVLRIAFQDADAQVLVEVRAEFPVGIPADYEPGDLIGMTINANMGVPLPAYGRYTFEVVLDGQSLKSIPLRVVPPVMRSPDA